MKLEKLGIFAILALLVCLPMPIVNAISATLSSPAAGFTTQETTIIFQCQADAAPSAVSKIELYTSIDGNLALEETRTFTDGALTQSAQFSVSGIPTGIFEWTCAAMDAAGTIAQATSRTFTVTSQVTDTALPTIQLQPINVVLIGSTFVVTASTTDDTGVAGVQANLEGTDYALTRTAGDAQDGVWTKTFSIDDYESVGEYAIDVTVTDQVGKTASAQVTVAIVEPTPPQIHVDSVSDILYDDPIVVRALLTDADGVSNVGVTFIGQRFSLTLDAGSTSKDGYWSVSIPASAYSQSGTFTLSFDATDIYGAKTTGITTQVTIQPTPDEISPILTPITATPVDLGANIPIRVQITDNRGVNSASVSISGIARSLTLQSGTLTDGVWGTTLDASIVTSVGPLVLDFQALDSNANVGAAQQTIQVDDTRSPVITILSPLPGSIVNSASVQLEYTVFDPSFQSSTYTDAQGTIQDAGSSVSVLLTFAEGERVITITATDSYGHQSQSQTAFAVDTSPPQATSFSFSPLSATLGTQISVLSSWTEPVDAVLYAREISSGDVITLNQGAMNTTQNFVFMVPDDWVGGYTLYIQGTDLAGHTRDTLLISSQVLTVQDNAGPALSSITGLAGQTPSRSVSFILKDATGIETASISANFQGAPLATSCQQSDATKTFTCSMSVGVTDQGAYPLTIKAKDLQGIEAVHTVSFVYDLTPPTPPAITATAHNSGTIHLSWQSPSDDLAASTRFTVYRSQESSVSTSTVYGTGEGLTFVDGTSLHGVKYYYKVAFFDAAGNAAFASIVFATADDRIRPKNPTDVSAGHANKKDDFLTVAWSTVLVDEDGNPDSAGIRYRVYRAQTDMDDKSDVSEFDRITETDKLEFRDYDIQENQRYYYTVTAFDDAGHENTRFRDSDWGIIGGEEDEEEKLAELAALRNAAAAESMLVREFIESLSRGQRFIWRPVLEGLWITNMEFEARRDLNDLTLELKPRMRTEFEVGKLYSAILFSYGTLGKQDVSGVSMVVTVPMLWLTENSYRAEEMHLYANSGAGNWQEVPMRITEKGDQAALFAADAPLAGEYALFAIRKYFDVELVTADIGDLFATYSANLPNDDEESNQTSKIQIFGSVGLSDLAVFGLLFAAFVIIGISGYFVVTRATLLSKAREKTEQ